ncbi:hypothetical protein [Luteolibacter sp. Populi]|uniref:hypothetical protein n=1 Tax=Luteolibacter sp. Populi TaxID=3230487 RepID=UPI0034667EA9
MAIEHTRIIWRALAGSALLIALLLALKNSDALPFSSRLTKAGGITPGDAPKSEADRTKPLRSEREIRRLAERWYQQILEKHPEMAVTYKEVPDNENGFLKLLDFIDRYGKHGSNGIPMPEEIDSMIGGKSPWDAAVFANWLEDNRALIDEISAIGLLPAQSVKGIDMERLKFTNARVPYDATKLLLARARLAMEQGDEATALQSVQAARGLADHMDRIELPHILSEAVAILLRNSATKYVLDHLLPQASPAGLAAWHDLMGNEAETPADLAHIFRGEWHNMTRNFLLPALLGDPAGLPDGWTGPADPDAVVEAYLAYFSNLTTRMKSSALNELVDLSAIPPETGGLSPDGASMLDTLSIGSSAWSKSWTRAQTDSAIARAAFLAAVGGELPLEPYTGKPFIIDEASGTIRVPEDPWFESMDYKPVKIPTLRTP